MKSIIVCMVISFTLVLSTYTYAEDKVVVIPLASSQSNQKGWQDLNILSANLSGLSDITLGSGELAGITLPAGGIANVAHSFVIPEDFSTGNDLTLKLLWHTASMACNVKLFTDFLSVTRNGSTPIIGAGGAAGLGIEDNGTLIADPAVANLSQQTLMTITSPDPLTPLQPLDAIVFGFNRNSLSPEDTCLQSLKITSITVNYETQ